MKTENHQRERLIMFKSKKFLILQAILLILLLESTLISAKAKKSVKIINTIEESEKLTAHCKSKDDDLGIHEIFFGKDIEWTFKVNFWRTTKYYCYMSWGGKSLAFDAYDYDRDYRYCGSCIWKFQTKGAFSWNYDKLIWDFRFPWANTN